MSMDVYAFLGIEMKMQDDRVELLQLGLLDKILETVDMVNCSPNEVPAKEDPLHSDLEGPPFAEWWDYASVVGMLMYLVHTRPDIQFAVHQCAKYTHHPHKSHANAVKKICRYLRGTRDRGLCFAKEPTREEIHITCYVDASFTPLYGYEDSNNVDSATSRSGYIIAVDDVPITWCSSGQGDIALSTTEAKYIALSTALRELLWVRRMVAEIATGLSLAYDKTTVVRSKVRQ